MLNLTFQTMYKKISDMYYRETDYKSDVVYLLTKHIYSWELMMLFNLKEFDQGVINTYILSLYELLKNNDRHILPSGLSVSSYILE